MNLIQEAFKVLKKEKKTYKKRNSEFLKSCIVNFRLTPIEKQQFMAFCQANEIQYTEVLRSFVKSIING